MTADEIQALIDAQEAILLAAQTDLVLAEAELAEAEQAVADTRAALAALEAERDGAAAGVSAIQTQIANVESEILRLEVLLANLGTWDPTADAHAFDDIWGTRANGSDAASRAAVIERRIGRKVRFAGIFDGRGPMASGRWSKLDATLDSMPDDSVVLVAWNTGDETKTRGKSATVPQVQEQRARLAAWAAGGGRVPFRRAFAHRAALPVGQISRIIDRPNHENNGVFEWSYSVKPTDFITPAQADSLSEQFAVTYRDWFEFVLNEAADVMGTNYRHMRWAFNLAGSASAMDGAIDLVRLAFPREERMPPGTRMLLTIDSYYKGPYSVPQLNTILGMVTTLASELPNVVAVGIDETGGHLGYGGISAAQKATHRAAMREYARIEMDWLHDQPKVSHFIPFEKDFRPAERDVCTSVIYDPLFRGPFAGQVAGADGQMFMSNYPDMAAPWIAG